MESRPKKRPRALPCKPLICLARLFGLTPVSFVVSGQREVMKLDLKWTSYSCGIVAARILFFLSRFQALLWYKENTIMTLVEMWNFKIQVLSSIMIQVAFIFYTTTLSDAMNVLLHGVSFSTRPIKRICLLGMGISVVTVYIFVQRFSNESFHAVNRRRVTAWVSAIIEINHSYSLLSDVVWVLLFAVCLCSIINRVSLLNSAIRTSNRFIYPYRRNFGLKFDLLFHQTQHLFRAFSFQILVSTFMVLLESVYRLYTMIRTARSSDKYSPHIAIYNGWILIFNAWKIVTILAASEYTRQVVSSFTITLEPSSNKATKKFG